MREKCPLNKFEECIYEDCGFWHWDTMGDHGCGIAMTPLKLKHLLGAIDDISDAIRED